MEDTPWWWLAASWGVRLAGWAVTKVVSRRRGGSEYADAARILAGLPAGSEVGGTRADGTSWYMRTLGPVRQGEKR